MTKSNISPGCGPLEIQAGPACCVMLHGSLASPHYFRETAEFLAARGYSVCAPLLAGHGTSWRDLQKTAWKELVESARAGVASAWEMGCDCFFLLGHSLGGMLAVELAAERPRGLRGTIAVSAPAGFPRWITDPFSAFTRLVPVLPRAFRKTPDLNVDLFNRYNRLPMEFYRRIIEAMPHNRELLPRIEVPLLIVHGKLDSNVPLPNARRLFREAGSEKKELFLVDGEGHGPLWYGRKREVMERIARFMDGAAGGGG